MTTIQSADGPHITVNTTDVTTDGQRNMQRRIDSFISEVNRLKAVITENSNAYMTLLRDFETEREARTNAQIERDAMALKLIAHRTLLQRVLDADAGCTGDVYTQLIEDVKAALTAKTEGQ